MWYLAADDADDAGHPGATECVIQRRRHLARLALRVAENSDERQ